jgi:hypothetical protein
MPDVVTSQPLTMLAGNGSSQIWYEDTYLGDSDVSQAVIVFPAGCAGLVGARLEFSGNPVYPAGDNPWFVFDDYVLVIPISGQGNSGQWRVVGYNNDYNDHTLQFYIYWDYLPIASQSGTSSLIAA